MSERYYSVESDTILIEWVKLGKVKVETPVEQEFWSKYVDLWHEYHEYASPLNSSIRVKYLSKQEIESITKQRDILHKKLAKLEVSQPILNILRRADLCGLDLELRFAGQTNSDELSLQEEINQTTQEETPAKKDKPSKFYLIPFIISIIFFISMGDVYYDFYTFARIIVSLFSVIFLFLLYIYNDKFSMWQLPVILITVLWNPIFPVYLDRETWLILDGCGMITEIVLGVYAYKLWEKQ